MKIWATIRDIMLLMVRVLAIIALSVLGYKTGCYPGAPEKRPEPDTLRINSLADQIDLLEQDKPVSDSIARIIIVAHGGKIRVRSKVGEGTTFAVVLPEKQRKNGAVEAA